MNFFSHIVFIIIVSLILPNSLYADIAGQKGFIIAKQVDLRDRGWQDVTSRVKMVLINKQGIESTRLIRTRTLENKNDGDKSLTIFDHPADVKGTVFLSLSHSANSDEQWLYQPTVKRVKQINSLNKSTSFMGSQFSYEDLGSFEIDKYAYKYIKNESLGSKMCYVVENYPKYKNSGYSKRIVWIDKQRYIPLKIEYYDRQNELLKTLYYTDYQQYLSKFWRAHKQVMKNHKDGKITEFTLSSFLFRRGFKNQETDKAILLFKH